MVLFVRRAMPDARFYREQAALCSEIASMLSDRDEAEKLRSAAMRYLKLAEQIERSSSGKRDT